MAKYNYFRKTVKVRQLDGTFKRQNVFAYTQKELEIKAKEKERVAEDRYQKSLKPKFIKVADEWNEAHQKNIEYNTWSSYQAPLKNLKDEFKNAYIEDITPQMIQALLNKLKAKGYARQTINLRKITANLIFDYSILRGYISFNPCGVVKVPVSKKKVVDLPSDATINIIKNNIDCDMGFLAYFIMFSGCRRGEALALRYEDIDFTNNTIHVSKSVYHENNKAFVKDTKTVNGVRDIPLLTPLKNVLSRNKKGYIFVHDNQIYSKSYINCEWKKYKRENTIECTFHQLRHVFATFCLDAGLDEKDTQIIMGHSKIETTRNIYTHIRESRKKVSADKLNKFLETG